MSLIGKMKLLILFFKKTPTRTSNANNRRKTRVMSDDEDMNMDETNQVEIPISSSNFSTLSSVQSFAGEDDDEGTRGSGSRQK